MIAAIIHQLANPANTASGNFRTTYSRCREVALRQSARTAIPPTASIIATSRLQPASTKLKIAAGRLIFNRNGDGAEAEAE